MPRDLRASFIPLAHGMHHRMFTTSAWHTTPRNPPPVPLLRLCTRDTRLNSHVTLRPTCAGCSPAGQDEAASTAELTRRQKDSIIAEMPLPGAAGVGRALDALEKTQVRAETHDAVR